MSSAYHNERAAPTSPIRSHNGSSQNDAVAANLPGFASAQELADAALPGLPASKSAMIRRADREGWTFIDRVGRGGGRLYRVTDLPADAQAALRERRLDEVGAAPVGRPKGSDFFTLNPDVAAVVEMYITQRNLSAPAVLKLLRQDFLHLPSKRSLQRFIARLEDERKVVIASIRDPDAYKGKYRLALGRADGNTDRAHQIWEIDTTPADVMTTDGRKAVLGLIDRWSRRVLFMVCESESAQSVRRLLITAITKWGVMPETVMTDQGSGFINGSIVSALDLLGIDHWPCPPGSPEKKPHVERVFGTMTRDLTELLDGFIGHNVAQAQKLRARARKQTGRAMIEASMSAAELQGALDAWVDGDYHIREHSELRMSPMRKWQSSPVAARAAPSADLLRMALSALVGPRTVGKRGIQWEGGRYWASGLVGWIGRQVMVRRVEDELGELLAFSPEGQFIDVAVNHERSGLSQAEFAAEARAQQAKWVRDQKADLRERTKGYTFEKARDSLLRRTAEEAGKLVHLPPPTQPHSTPAMDTLSEGAGSSVPQPRKRGRAASAQIITMTKTPAQKVREADAVLAAAETGQQVDQDELRRAQLYATTSEYRAQKMVTDHLAPASQSTSA